MPSQVYTYLYLRQVTLILSKQLFIGYLGTTYVIKKTLSSFSPTLKLTTVCYTYCSETTMKMGHNNKLRILDTRTLGHSQFFGFRSMACERNFNYRNRFRYQCETKISYRLLYAAIAGSTSSSLI